MLSYVTYATLLHLCAQACGYGQYMGCYKDDLNKRAMTGASKQITEMTLQLCEQHCKEYVNVFTYFGASHYTRCYCGDVYSVHGEAPSGGCNTPCPGNTDQMCGAHYALSVYAVCPSLTWGRDCNKVCHCKDQLVCTRSDGECLKGCLPGWSGHSCGDSICSINNGGCDQECEGNGVVPWCRCWSGYQLGGDPKTCKDVDECLQTTDTCTQKCDNTVGSYTCSCWSGYTPEPDGINCKDVDECWEGTDTCPQKCDNTISSYTCSCWSGYTPEPDGRNCKDIDECTSRTDECAQLCNNTAGSYNCSCWDGYNLQQDGRNCTDIDECSLTTDTCHHSCVNTMGSYSCSCRSGYSLEPDGRNCTDIDECSLKTHKCPQKCINTEGSYSCSCWAGYSLDSDGRNCKDDDECLSTAHGCSHLCNNTNGSYRCDCWDGYILQEDGQTCADIDECSSSSHNCSQKCENFEGNYTCSCLDGYRPEPGTTCEEVAPGGPPLAIIGGVAAAALIILAFVFLVIVLRRRQTRQKKREKSATHGSPNATMDRISEVKIESEARPHIMMQPLHGVNESTEATDDTPTSDNIVEATYVNQGDVNAVPSNKLNVTEIETHIINERQNNSAGFKREFGMISYQRRGTCIEAQKVDKEMNKFQNILPYDHSRFVLSAVDTEKQSDYINASIIEVQYGPDKYIASQGPQKATTEDFWRMVCQTEARVIVMLTNPREGKKIKCDEYWPQEGTKNYGTIAVKLVKEEPKPNCVRRTLLVTGQNGVQFEVTQYLFRIWPDHGVLRTPTALLTLLYRVRQEPMAGKPIVIHCSAGVGRTGTFIAIDQLLYQAESEGCVDVVACVDGLRNSRMNMVQTAAQYGFIYEAVLEATTIGTSSFRCSDYTQPEQYKVIVQSCLKHYQFLTSSTPCPEGPEVKAGLENKTKNRVDTFLPLDEHRVQLTSSTGDSAYINAVFVKGYNHTKEYISTQVPLATTRAEFWEVVWECNCTNIIVLESGQTLEKLGQFLPCPASETVTYGDLVVRGRERTPSDSFEELEVVIAKQHVYDNTLTQLGQDEGRSIRVLVVTGDDLTEKSLLGVAVNCNNTRHRDSKEPIVVVCEDAVTKCGLFMATTILLNMINQENQVDVFSAVRTIREHRPEFIVTEDQYLLIHQAVAAYLRNCAVYSD